MNTNIWNVLFFGLLAFSLTALTGCGEDDDGDSSDSGSTCSSDNDCKGDRICNNGACVDPSGGSGSSNGNTSNGNTSNGNTSNGNTNTSNGSTSSSSASCCLNGTFFACSSAADADACFNNFAPGNCSPDASRNSMCGGSSNGNTSNGNTSNGNTSNGNTSNGNTKKATGETCEVNSECQGGACIVRNDGDILGYCSERCDSFADCPTFWDCEELGNAAGRYCIEG